MRINFCSRGCFVPLVRLCCNRPLNIVFRKGKLRYGSSGCPRLNTRIDDGKEQVAVRSLSDARNNIDRSLSRVASSAARVIAIQSSSRYSKVATARTSDNTLANCNELILRTRSCGIEVGTDQEMGYRRQVCTVRALQVFDICFVITFRDGWTGTP